MDAEELACVGLCGFIWRARNEVSKVSEAEWACQSAAYTTGSLRLALPSHEWQENTRMTAISVSLPVPFCTGTEASW